MICTDAAAFKPLGLVDAMYSVTKPFLSPAAAAAAATTGNAHVCRHLACCAYAIFGCVQPTAQDCILG
jgi:hypothetical protein